MPCKARDERLVHELDDYHKEIPPVFNRVGEYLLDDKCWFEVRGKAYLKRKEDFLFELELYNTLEVDVQVVESLKVLMIKFPRSLTKEQKNLIRNYDNYKAVRGCKRNSMMLIRNLRTRIKTFRDQYDSTI